MLVPIFKFYWVTKSKHLGFTRFCKGPLNEEEMYMIEIEKVHRAPWPFAHLCPPASCPPNFLPERQPL